MKSVNTRGVRVLLVKRRKSEGILIRLSPLPTLFQTAPLPSRSNVVPQQPSSLTDLGPSLLSKQMTIQLESNPERRLMRITEEDKTTAVFAELPSTGKFMWEHAMFVQLLLC